MAGALRAFGRNDLRGIGREPLMFGLLLAPAGWIALVRFGTPAAGDLLADRYGVDLTRYHPLILTAFLLLTSPIVVGALVSFLVLDERDAGTLTALRVSPVPLRSFVVYRAGLALVLTAVYTVVTIGASGLFPAQRWPELVAIGLATGPSGLLVILVLLAFAGNKVEGLAVVRALGILVAGLPLIPYFLDSAWQWWFGLIPTFWPAKAFWLVCAGGTWWPVALVGVLHNLALAYPLYRRFARRV
ncbi:ABC transporter permease [Goodfellowiella coeruleoviolacea]|uniref:Fluoroquinolone transport system permease protein n=1 Tax=Goodfellowiella coeruleoviolacea TaxID=334858 RepID=A0AAE3GCS9_9PSEU|nr:ABC transporter permease [Goodfellowiella coeruleoviolacea]MCP2165715.1 fluoroquinolone transport system permease protein [Goodfellowiella coeruleoviolacea]